MVVLCEKMSLWLELISVLHELKVCWGGFVCIGSYRMEVQSNRVIEDKRNMSSAGGNLHFLIPPFFLSIYKITFLQITNQAFSEIIASMLGNPLVK